MQKKICFIAPKAYQLFNTDIKSTFGGAEVQLSLLAKEFAKSKDLNISFLVADYGQKEQERYESVIVYKSLDFKSSFLKQIYTFFLVFRKVNADIYIQRSLTPFSGIIALYCKIFGKKFIYMVAHDDETDGSDTLYNKLVGRIVIKANFKLSHKIIVQNEIQKSNLLKRGFSSEIIKSGYKIVKKNTIEKNYILWVSRNETWKRPEIFIKLAKMNPQQSFVMICPEATNNKENYSLLKKQAEQVPNLEFISFIPFNQINSYFEKAKIFVNTSLSEGFPNTFIQSMNNGVPILSMNVDPNKLLKEHECGIYCNNIFDELNEGLKKLSRDNIFYSKIQENGYNYVKQNHNIESTVQNIKKII